MNAPLNTLVDEDESMKRRGELRIAWRYENPSTANQTADRSGPIFGHTFDLSSRLSPPVSIDENTCWVRYPAVDRKNATFHDSTRSRRAMKRWTNLLFSADSYNYDTLYAHIAKMLENPQYNCNLPSENRTVLRIALVSIASGLWTGNLFAFLIKLRILLRNHCATCFITIQPKLLEVSWSVELSFRFVCVLNFCAFQNPKDLCRIEHLSDTVIELKSLLNDGNPSYEDYDGLVILKKLPSGNSWAPIIPETNDWAFKMRKNRFIVEVSFLLCELNCFRSEEHT